MIIAEWNVASPDSCDFGLVLDKKKKKKKKISFGFYFISYG
jgi:hypothetical protein